MTRYVALLRAVNVAGTGKLSASELRAAAEAAGFDAARTILQSGNLVFSANGSATELEDRLETRLRLDLALATNVMVRSASAWRRIIDANPFPETARADPSHLLLLVLKTPARSTDVASADGPEQMQIATTEAYVTYPEGIGRSKLTLARIERHLGTLATGRNWSTVQKIAARLDA